MTPPPVYVLDANVFIEASRRYYAFDIAPSFWQSLIECASKGRIVSIDRVKAELVRGKDELAEWAAEEFHSWFLSTRESTTLDIYRDIMIWAYSQSQYSDEAKAEFARAENADAWLVAHAKVSGNVLVTHEQADPNVKRRVPLPNVCQAFSVHYVDTFQMIRALGIKLG
jgi:hypothetical protein